MSEPKKRTPSPLRPPLMGIAAGLAVLATGLVNLFPGPEVETVARGLAIVALAAFIFAATLGTYRFFEVIWRGGQGDFDAIIDSVHRNHLPTYLFVLFGGATGLLSEDFQTDPGSNSSPLIALLLLGIGLVGVVLNGFRKLVTPQNRWATWGIFNPNRWPAFLQVTLGLTMILWFVAEIAFFIPLAFLYYILSVLVLIVESTGL